VGKSVTSLGGASQERIDGETLPRTACNPSRSGEGVEQAIQAAKRQTREESQRRKGGWNGGRPNTTRPLMAEEKLVTTVGKSLAKPEQTAEKRPHRGVCAITKGVHCPSVLNRYEIPELKYYRGEGNTPTG